MASRHDALNLPRDLGDGLLLRLASPADTDELADFNTRVLLEGEDPPEILSTWTRDLMSGRHPTTSAQDFVVVEDTKTASIVSSSCLIPQTWAYEDIAFPVGRPELVATDPAYRRRGLMRAVFGAIHDLSAAYGQMVQGITGIPWFYRQFGYEYALPLGGSRDLNASDVPMLKAGESEPYQCRQATEADIPIIMRLYDRQRIGKLVTTLIDQDRWRYDLSGHSPGSDQEYRAYCILNGEDQVVGYYSTQARLRGSRLNVWEIVVEARISLRSVLPSVMRAVKANIEAYAAEAGREKAAPTVIRLALGQEHLVYEAWDAKIGRLRPPYALYIRLPDLPFFIRHIAPVLDKRLERSVMNGFSGELRITFYQGGLCLIFQEGRLSQVTDWQAPDTDQRWDGAGFPPLTFLQLLFGYRSLAELRYAFPDCWADEEPALLLNALFPKQASWVLPLG
jgi:hypothetical protein